MSAARRGVPKSREHTEKNRLSHIGIVPSEETRKAMSEAQRRRWARWHAEREADRG